MEKALLSCIIKKNVDDTYTFIGSDETIDRDGEIIKVDGWQLANYKKNPVILWGHNHTVPAIGKAKRVYKQDNKLKFKIQFAKPGTYDLADTVKALVDDDIIKSVSVGYMPLEREYPSDGEKKKKPTVITTKAELYELSIVNVPANQNAVREAMISKGYDEKQISLITEEKAVIPYKNLGKDDEGAAWDAGAEIKAADVSDLKLICAWYDKANPDIKGSYKLPHHHAKGHKAVWRGVAAAMAALLGARGGVNIPSGDRKGVYNHLAKHYKEFNKNVPDFKEAEDDIKDYLENLSEKLDTVFEKVIELEDEIIKQKGKSKYEELLKEALAEKPLEKKHNPFRIEKVNKKITEVIKHG